MGQILVKPSDLLVFAGIAVAILIGIFQIGTSAIDEERRKTDWKARAYYIMADKLAFIGIGYLLAIIFILCGLQGISFNSVLLLSVLMFLVFSSTMGWCFVGHQKRKFDKWLREWITAKYLDLKSKEPPESQAQ